MNIYIILILIGFVLLLLAIMYFVLGGIATTEYQEEKEKTAKKEKHKKEKIEEPSTNNIVPQVQLMMEREAYNPAIELCKKELARNHSFHELRYYFALCLFHTNLYSECLQQTFLLEKFKPGKVEVILLSAKANEALGNKSKAIEEYKKVIRIDERNLEAHQRLSELCYQHGMKNTALKLFQRIIHFLPDGDKKIAYYYMMIGNIYADAMEWQIAIKHYKTALQIDPDLQEVLEKLKEAYKNYGDPEAAVEYLKRAIEVAPYEKETYFLYEDVINLLYQAGEFDDAFNYCQEALKFENADINALQNIIARIYLQTEKTEESIDLIKQALKTAPENIYLRQTLARAYANLKDYEQAGAVYREIFQIADNFQLPLLRSNFSAILCEEATDKFNKQDYTEAYNLFVRAVRYDDQNAEIYYQIGYIAYISKNYQEAVKQLVRAIQLAPSNVKYYQTLAALYEKVDNVYEALKTYQEIIALDPNNAAAYSAIGTIYAKQREIETAIEAFTNSIEINPEDANTRYNLALAYELVGEIELAREEYERVLQINPEHKEASNNLRLLGR